MIIKCAAYKNGELIGDVAIDNISDVITQPDTFIWMGLHEPEEALLTKIQEEFGLHHLAIDDARNASQRSKIEQYGDSLFIVVKTVQGDGSKIETGETHFFVGKNFLVSLRHGERTGYSSIRDHWENNPKLLKKGPGFVLYTILDFVVDRYRDTIIQFETEFDQLESDIFKGEFDRIAIAQFYDLKRRLLHLRSAAIPVEDICHQLMRFHDDIIPKELRVYFRDIQDHAAQVVTMTESLREMISSAIQVNLGVVAMIQNDVVKRLAGWAAILAIPTVIFSLYGMNFSAMPELHWRFGYPAVLAVTLACSVALYQKLKRSGWV